MRTFKDILESAKGKAYQQFLDKSPSNWGEEKVVAYGTKKGYKVIGVCGHGKIDGIVLFGLDTSDKAYVGKEAKVKTGQTVFRYATRNSMAGDIFPLVKIDVKRGLLYNLSQKSSDGEIDHAEFETKSSKLRYLRLHKGANLRDITGFDPGFGSMKESVDLDEAISVQDIKKLDGKTVSPTQWKTIRTSKDIKKISMLGKTGSKGSTKHGVIFKDTTSIDIFVESTLIEAKQTPLEQMQDIVKNKQAKKIGGVMVDMFTASTITQAYAKVNPAIKAKMEKSSLDMLVGLAQKMMGMKESVQESANLEEGKMKEFHDYIAQGKSAQWIAKKMGLDMKTVKELMADMKESTVPKTLSDIRAER